MSDAAKVSPRVHRALQAGAPSAAAVRRPRSRVLPNGTAAVPPSLGVFERACEWYQADAHVAVPADTDIRVLTLGERCAMSIAVRQDETVVFSAATSLRRHTFTRRRLRWLLLRQRFPTRVSVKICVHGACQPL